MDAREDAGVRARPLRRPRAEGLRAPVSPKEKPADGSRVEASPRLCVASGASVRKDTCVIAGATPHTNLYSNLAIAATTLLGFALVMEIFAIERTLAIRRRTEKEREEEPKYEHEWYGHHIGSIVALALWIIGCTALSMWWWWLIVHGTGTLIALGVLYSVPVLFALASIAYALGNRHLPTPTMVDLDDGGMLVLAHRGPRGTLWVLGFDRDGNPTGSKPLRELWDHSQSG